MVFFLFSFCRVLGGCGESRMRRRTVAFFLLALTLLQKAILQYFNTGDWIEYWIGPWNSIWSWPRTTTTATTATTATTKRVPCHQRSWRIRTVCIALLRPEPIVTPSFLQKYPACSLLVLYDQPDDYCTLCDLVREFSTLNDTTPIQTNPSTVSSHNNEFNPTKNNPEEDPQAPYSIEKAVVSATHFISGPHFTEMIHSLTPGIRLFWILLYF